MGLFKIKTKLGGERKLATLYLFEHAPQDPMAKKQFELAKIEEQRKRLETEKALEMKKQEQA